MKLETTVLAGVVVITLLAVTTMIQAAGIGRALVTDLKGQATADQRPLSPFSVCYDGDSIEVAEGGQLTLVLTRPLYEFVVTGPAKVRLSGHGLTLVSGHPPKQRDLFPGRNLQLQEGLIEQASTRTRGDSQQTALHQLSPNGTLIESSPEFRWVTSELIGPVSFTLFDAEARPLYTQDRAEPGMQVPPTLLLKARKRYTWILTGRRMDGRETRAQGNFIVADAAQLEWRRQLGDCSQPTAKQVACALLLEQAGFRSDAMHIWRELAKSSPNQARLRAYRTLEP